MYNVGVDQKRPGFFKQPVEPWMIVFSAIMLIGAVVVGVIDENYVPTWINAVCLAAPVLVVAVAIQKTISN